MGSRICVAKSSLVKPEQMTGAHELCMLIDRVVMRHPTAVVELKTPYYNLAVHCRRREWFHRCRCSLNCSIHLQSSHYQPTWLPIQSYLCSVYPTHV